MSETAGTAAGKSSPHEEIAIESRDIQKAAQVLMITEGQRIVFKKIESLDEANALSRLRQRIGVARKRIKEIFTPIKRKIDEAKAEALKQERGLDQPLLVLDDAAYAEIKRYSRMLEDERQRKQREADEKAKKEHETRAQDTAEIVEAAGNKEAAADIIERAVATPPPPVVVEKPKIEGSTSKKVWHCRVKDLRAFLIAAPNDPLLWAGVENSKVKEELDKWANKQAPLMRSALNNYPGLEAWEEDEIARSRSA